MYGKRVHVVPVGDAVERMVAPATELGADVVYLLAHATTDADTDRTARDRPPIAVDGSDALDGSLAQLRSDGFDTTAAAAAQLTTAGIDVVVEFVDQNDVYSILGLVTTITHRRDSGDDVAVNVSTGTRLATIGAALARMDEDTDAAAYHVPESESVPATDVSDAVADVPDYPLNSPSRDALTAMAIVVALDTDVYTSKKSDLIDWGLRLRAEADVSIGYVERIVQSYRDRNDVTAAPTTFDDLDSAGKKGAYRTLRTGVLDTLLDQGYLSIDDEQVGRADLVALEPAGQAALRAFRHKILDVIDALAASSEGDSLPSALAPRLTE